MATGLPIVPIVIRNSESVAGRHAAKLNPGSVDIAVLPPVSVETGRYGTCGNGRADPDGLPGGPGRMPRGSSRMVVGRDRVAGRLEYESQGRLIA